ncbi:response regulator [Ekhidna sp.]|uniref:response regulator n=1 Tax=Ekhidna sp. TaxID=2608089 RepID=UPI0032EE0BC1
MKVNSKSIGGRIGVGYFLMTCVVVIVVLTSLFISRQAKDSANQLFNLRAPTARASLKAVTGINHASSALRGWIILQDSLYIDERSKAWNDEIFPAFEEMDRLSEGWTNPENSKRFLRAGRLLTQLENHQNEIENLYLIDPERAREILAEEASDVALEIKDLLSTMADNQQELMVADFGLLVDQMNTLVISEWSALLVGAFLSILLGFIVTRSITRPVNDAVGVANEIGRGNLDTEINVGGLTELDLLGNSLRDMRDSLIRRKKESERYDWLTTGHNQMYEAMRGEKDLVQLSNDTIKFIAEYTDSDIGAFYLLNDDSNTLSLQGTYALDENGDNLSYKMGKGLVGQAAVSGEIQEYSNLDEVSLRKSSAIIEAAPKNVVIAPIRFKDQILGVIEIGKDQRYLDIEKEFLEAISESVGITISSAIAKAKVQELLEETQRQSEELQQQQEELQASNEELEEQTLKLKEQQEELQASNEELEEQTQIVEQKNQDLETARTDIELKAKQLEISSKYKSEFLANMSHELRTPLNSLLILAKDLKDNKGNNLSEDQIESAEIILKSGQDLLNLINEILDLSKIEAGKMELNASQFTINELVNELKRGFDKQASMKGLDFEIEVDAALPENIATDKQRLGQVLRNLISNAIKFTEKGKVAVKFKSYSDIHMAVSVTDTGIGIPKDKHQVVFEAFQQADGGTSRRFGGTGLGLSISRELAKLLNGKLELKSEPGEGSTFTFIFPMNVAVSTYVDHIPDRKESLIIPSNGSETEYDIKDDRQEISGRDHSILIIEDDEDFANIVAKQAKGKGFKYLLAHSGESGIRLARDFQPTAIILDLQLPGIDGQTVLRELKSDPNLRHIPVHIISAEEKRLDLFKLGAVEYITKPVKKEQLNQAFERIENFANRKMKNLLVIEDDNNLRRSIIKLIGNGDVQCLEASSAADALEVYKNEQVDCMVMDLGLPDMSGFELIKKMEGIKQGQVPPIIIYTGKELTKKQSQELEQYAETIIVKGVKSEERLLDETALFLHRTVKNLPPQKQEIITSLYDKDKVFQGKKVLVVDDDMRNVFALSKVLTERGFEIIKGDTGKAALEQLKHHSDVDIVLMDIMMPEMDGYECMQEIRKQKKFKELPIISLTAKAMKDDRQKCIDAGASDYISKPVDVDRLLSLMRIWLSK